MCADCGYPSDSHYVLGVAYPSMLMDGHGEFMRTESVRKAASSYIGSRLVGFNHEDGTEGHATVTDSMVWPEEFGVFKFVGSDGTEQEIHPGDWLMGALFDAETWPDIRKGKYTGWSIQGMAARREVEG